jgi:hypothetical protein
LIAFIQTIAYELGPIAPATLPTKERALRRGGVLEHNSQLP